MTTSLLDWSDFPNHGGLGESIQTINNIIRSLKFEPQKLKIYKKEYFILFIFWETF